MAADMTGSDTASPSKPATINLQDEPVKIKETDASERDPQHLNDHVKVQFHDIIAEPDTEAQSPDKVWMLSDQAFVATKLWTYRILSLVLGLPCAVCWGCQFATLAFCNVWCCMPCLKVCDIKLLWLRRLCCGCSGALIAPMAENVGKLFGNVRAKITTDKV
ncbi:Caveolin-3 [Lamellibrachia satsuma]|nr:Caveolin-3 [Lamellibrachia satsuma]